MKDIKVGQKFLSRGREVEIVCVTSKIPEYPVIDDYGDNYTKKGCFYDYKTDDSLDLQPIPAKITDGVEFCGPEYRAEFERLVAEGREFEYRANAEWMKNGSAAFVDFVHYRLLPQHRDAVGNVLKVGDRVEYEGERYEIEGLDKTVAYFPKGVCGCLKNCRKLTTRTRPLCADDLMQHRTALFQHGVGLKCYPIGPFDESEVRIGDLNVSYDDLRQNYEWSPSADKPWQPCEVTEEVLV